MEAKSITHEERTAAANYLADTRAALVDTVSDLNEAAWSFKPAPDRWSVAEILEHVVLVESRLQGFIEQLPTTGTEALDHPTEAIDRFILEQIPVRTQKIQAPESVQPTGRWTGPKALAEFVAVRSRPVELLSAPGLRGRTRPHPVFGPWDGYQWLLATGAHSARHTDQMREVKASLELRRTVSATSA